MKGQQVTLSEMAEAADERARWLSGSADRARDEAQKAAERADKQAHAQHLAWAAQDDRKALVFERMASLLRIMGTFEDRARTFVAGLIKEHQS